MAIQVKTEETATERSSIVNVVSKTISTGTVKPPTSGRPTQRYGSRYA